MPYHVAASYNILWIIYIKLHKDKPNNACYHLIIYLSLSYSDIMSFSPCELTYIFLNYELCVTNVLRMTRNLIYE